MSAFDDLPHTALLWLSMHVVVLVAYVPINLIRLKYSGGHINHLYRLIGSHIMTFILAVDFYLYSAYFGQLNIGYICKISIMCEKVINYPFLKSTIYNK